MNKAKKITATLIALALSAGLSLPASAHVAETTSKNAEAIETLKALSIMVGDKDTGEYRESEPIKRSEFAKVAVHALGIEDVAIKNADTRFADVVENHWASGYINVASQQGLIIGDPDGNFRPDDSISYAEAMTILVRMTGYEPSAEAKGAYPGGYILVGSENSLDTKVSVSSANEAVTRGAVAQMTFNALTTKLMEQTGFGNSLDYSIVDKTILKDKLEVEKVTGILTADGNTSIDGAAAVNRESARIGDAVYAKGGIDASAYLGQYVTAYAEEDEQTGEMTLLLIYPDSRKTTVTEIAADDIETLTAEKAEYWTGENSGRLIKAEISADADFIYNGKAESMENLEIPASGKVVLTDNNADGKADVVAVTEYRNIVLDDKSSVSYTVADKYGNEALVLDMEDDDKTITIKDAEGTEIAFEELTEWDVLSVAESRDKKLVTVVVSRNAVSGKVSETIGEKIVINDTEYEAAANYTETISLDKEATFLLDADGKIAAVKENHSEGLNYAYLITAEQTRGIDKELEIKLFTAEGKTVVIKGADKITVDDENGKNAEQVLSLLREGGDAVTAQLISYKLNSEGKICEIDRALDKSDGAPESYSGVFVKNAELSEAEYISKTGKIGGINISEDTLVFDIPVGSTDSEEFEVRDMSMFENGAKYNLSVYDMTEDMSAKVVVVTSSDSEASVQSPVLVIDKVTKTSNADGQPVLKIYGLCEGNEVALMGEEGFSMSLNKGDIVSYKTNLNGEIDGMTKLFDITEKGTEMVKDLSDDVSIVYGKVVKRFTDSVNVSVNDAAAENYKTSGATVYKYDSTRASALVTVAEAADIQKYDAAAPERVFMKLHEGQVQEIVIIK